MSDADSTEDLAHRARAGDREAFEELIRPLRSRLEDQVQARMGERVRATVEAEEVVQETLLKAYESIERLEWQGEEAFYRWLGVIAEHVIWHHAEGASRFHLQLDRDHAADGSSESMDRRVALKVLPAGVAADRKVFLRFLREAQTAGKLRHPSIVQVHAMGVDAGTPYYAMKSVRQP